METEALKAGGALVDAIRDMVEKYNAPRIIDINGRDALDKAGVLLVPDGMTSLDLLPILERLADQPRRRRGTVAVHDLESLVELCERFKDDQSAVFASMEGGTPLMTAIFDYHQSGGPGVGKPRFGEHRAVYRFPLSVEWQAWHGQDGKMMTQIEFAEFIENHIGEIVPVPVGEEGALAPETLALQQMLGGSFAPPNRMMEIAKGLAMKEGVSVKGFTSLPTGEARMEFITQHTDQDGKPLNVPTLFLICIPIFEAGALYRIAVRLRYRLRDGRVNWAFQMYRADRAIRHAFDEARGVAAQGTELPVYSGIPETLPSQSR